MSTALATRPITDLDDQSLGTVLAKSGFFSDTRDAAQAIVKVLAGRELGFGPVASMVGIHIIKGKPVISATLLGAAIKRSGRYTYRITRLDDTGCEITFFESGQALIPTSSFTIEDAKAAGLLGNDTWRKFPRNMLFARALSNGARWHCPDIFGGPIYTPDELGVPVNEEGEVIEIGPPPAAKPAPMTADEANAVIREVKHLVLKIKELGETPAPKPEGKLADLSHEAAQAYVETLRKQQRDALAKLPKDEVEEGEIVAEPAL